MKKLILIITSALVINGAINAQQSAQNKQLDSLDIFISSRINETDPGVAVIIAQNGKTIYETYRGMANIEIKEPLSSKNTMGIASMSKQFEGMAILSLIDQGKCTLEDRIDKYLKDLPAEANPLTIRQLLTHVSGLPELTQNKYFMSNLQTPNSIEDIIKIAFQMPTRHKSGEQYMYCNTGYAIVVKLIEKFSGMSYRDYLQQQFFGPLNMTNTYSCDINHDAINITNRYMEDSSGFHDAEKIHFSNLIGGGGIISNVTDMKIWADALLTGNKLPKNYKDMWVTTKLNNGKDTQYGLGMGTSEVNGELFYYHPGQGSGMNAINLIFPNKQISITVIRNVSKPSCSSPEIALYAFDLLSRKKNN